jgi:hypothetical protein
MELKNLIIDAGIPDQQFTERMMKRGIQRIAVQNKDSTIWPANPHSSFWSPCYCSVFTRFWRRTCLSTAMCAITPVFCWIRRTSILLCRIRSIWICSRARDLWRSRPIRIFIITATASRKLACVKHIWIIWMFISDPWRCTWANSRSFEARPKCVYHRYRISQRSALVSTYGF